MIEKKGTSRKLSIIAGYVWSSSPMQLRRLTGQLNLRCSLTNLIENQAPTESHPYLDFFGE
jgi:hypothetical protein